MAKALITLANGTAINIEGTTEEIKHLLDYYGGQYLTMKPQEGVHPTPKSVSREKASTTKIPAPKDTGAAVPLAEIVNLVKNCDDADKIETQILDRTSQVNRTLLPMFIVSKHMHNAYGLTTGEISKVTSDLGIPVQTANVSHALSGSAARYVMGDRVRKQGQPVRYKLSRRGVKYLHAVIEGKEDG